MANSKLYVGNLSFNLSDDDIRDHFLRSSGAQIRLRCLGIPERADERGEGQAGGCLRGLGECRRG